MTKIGGSRVPLKVARFAHNVVKWDIFDDFHLLCERCKESRRRRVVSLELIDHCKKKPHNFLSPFSLKQGSPFQALDWTTQVPPMPRISRLGKYVEKSLMYHCYFCDTTTRRKGRRTAAKHSGKKSLKKSHFSIFKIELTIDELGALVFKWQR